MNKKKRIAILLAVIIVVAVGIIIAVASHQKQEMDFEGLLEQGKVDVIREYLRENIHQYGKLKDSRTILKDVTGEDFDPKYYVRYLKEKYGKLYEVEA